ncbi:MAG: hypothetical protein ABR523_03510 [Desulfurivibrionaceae bacterium]
MEAIAPSRQHLFCRQKDDIGPENAYNFAIVIHGDDKLTKTVLLDAIARAKRRSNPFSINYINSGPFPSCHENS